MFRCWKRLDYPGLEVLNLSEDEAGWRARSAITDGGETPFALVCNWQLDKDWRSRSLELTCISAGGEHWVVIERAAPMSWRVDGLRRLDLEGCEEIDLSATPFCNGLALKRLGDEPGEMNALYVPAPSLAPVASLQRYEKLGARQWRYVDLGAAKGFTAISDFDSEVSWVVTRACSRLSTAPIPAHNRPANVAGRFP